MLGGSPPALPSLEHTMVTIDLLNTVLPEEGWYAVVGIKGTSTKQKFVQTREEVDAVAKEFVDNNNNVFFGCAKYATNKSRTKDNVLALKSVWLDIDCGEGKPYADQAAGLVALREFIDLVGLPAPIIVSSGRGLHVYWTFTENVTRQQWEPLAARLKELCSTHKFMVDHAVMEASRILRIPGTLNFKQDPPLPVEIMEVGAPVEFETFKSLIGVKELSPIFGTIDPKFEPNEITLAAMGNTVQRFKNIMIRGENGCQQLNYAFLNQEETPEPLWWSSLTVANQCIDREKAIHMMSNKHPDYDPIATERKASQGGDSAGPHKCETFEKHNPGGCDGCKWKGKIPGPIALSKEVVEAEEPEEESGELEFTDEPTIVIPKYPSPYKRGAGGGIYLPPGKDEAEPICVYEHDLYVVKLMEDPADGLSALVRLHLPMDGVKEFVVPNSIITVKDELRKVLAKNGVAGSTSQMAHLATYMNIFVKTLQYKHKAEIMRTQFGWVENDTKFILGDREISKDGIFGSPPSSVTKALAHYLQPAGTLEKWKEVFNLYAKPGLEGNAFAALTAFGAPLFKLTGLKGAIINVMFKKGGSGKSTALFMCNSVYGAPEALCSIWKDTNNAKMQRLGLLNNLPYTVDEITNISAEDFSDLAYGMSQGRGKDRMKGATNELRDNSTTWQTISLASSNASFYEKLSSAKAGANAEMLRLFEYEIAPTDIISVEEGKRMFDHQLRENYGHAGEIYLQWLVNNKDEAKRIFDKAQSMIDQALRLTAPERFWSGLVACNIAGGVIAKRLKLHDYDMNAIFNWAAEAVKGMRHEIKPPLDDAPSILGDYINRHMQNILVVKADNDNRTSTASLPSLEPKGQLLIRYEPDTKQLYVVTRDFRSDCVERQINYKDTLQELRRRGFFKETMNKRMSKGMKIVSPAVNTLVFDCSDPGFLDMDGLIAPQLPNENRPS